MTQPKLIVDKEVFESLKMLVGQWEGHTETGRKLRVSYQLHARDSVLVETWELGTTTALTLYHMDVDTLMATHYCPLCNQPRLLFSKEHSQAHLVFDFASATSMSSATEAHQHRFELNILDANTFWRSETYTENGLSHTEATTFSRDTDV